MENTMFTYDSIYGQKERASKNGLIAILDRDIFCGLVDKHFRDKNGILHCAYSNLPISQDKLELEHIIPISLGGGTVYFNCVPSLSEINGRNGKYNYFLFDWWEKSGYYSEELLERLVNYLFEAYNVMIKNGFTFIEKKESLNIDDIEELINEDSNLDSDDNEDQHIRKNPYIYYNFLKDCVSRLNNEKYIQRFNELVKTGIFELIENYDDYLEMFNSYFKEKSTIDLSNLIATMNIPYIVSKFNCSKEDLILNIDDKINKIYVTLLNNMTYKISIDTLLINICRNVDVLLADETNIDKINYIINNLEYSKDDKINMLLDYYKKFGEWPSNYKTIGKYNFSIASFKDKVRSGEIEITSSQREKILEVDSAFFMNQNVKATEEAAKRVIEFYKTYGRRPVLKRNPQTELEKYESLLAGSVQRLKLTNNLDESIKSELLYHDQNFFDDYNYIRVKNVIEESIKYYLENNHWPSRKSSAEGVSKLAANLTFYRLREDIMPIDLVKKIKEVDSKFFMNQNERKTMETVESLLEFYDINGRWPTKKKVIENPMQSYENILAGRMYNIKSNGIIISDSQKKEFLDRDEYFFIDKRKIVKNARCEELLKYFDEYGRWPRIINDPKDENEKVETKLANFLRRFRSGLDISDFYHQELLKRDPNVFKNQNDSQTQQLLHDLIEFYDTYNHWPVKTKKVINEEQAIGNSLVDAMKSFKFRINSKILETHQVLILELLKRDIHFFEDGNDVSIKEKINKVIKFYSEFGHWPTSSENEQLNSFMYNARKGKIGLTPIQIKELKTIDPTLDLSESKEKPIYIYLSTINPNGKEIIEKRNIETAEIKK